MKVNCFKAYDIRGKLFEEINEEIAYRIGRATAQSQNAKSAVGFDARASSSIWLMLAKGPDAGANVVDIGLSGTEEMYAAVVKGRVLSSISQPR